MTHRLVFGIVLLLLTITVPSATGQDTESILNNLQPITIDNAPQLSEIAILGRGTATVLDWRPDGEVLVVGTATGLWLLDAELNLIDHPPVIENVIAAAWNPTGTHIAVAGTDDDSCRIELWDATFTNPDDIDLCGYDIRWSPDGTRLAVFLEDSEIALIDADTGDPIATVIGLVGVWSPSGALFFTQTAYSYTYAETPALYTWDGQTGEQILRIEHNPEPGFPHIGWAIDEHTVGMLCIEYDEEYSDGEVGLCEIDMQSGMSVMTLPFFEFVLGRDRLPVNLTWNNTRTQLAFHFVTRTRGFLDLIFVYDPEQGEQHFVGDGEVFDWQPGSEVITAAVGNGFIRNYDIQTGDILAETMPFTAPVNDVAWRPDHHQVASSPFGYEQFVRVWDLDDSHTEPAFLIETEISEYIRYSPDGAELVTEGTVRTDIVVYYIVMGWDADSGERIRWIDSFYDQGSMPMRVWNREYTLIAQANDDATEVVLPNGLTHPITYRLRGISWSPDSSMLANVTSNADYDFQIAISDTESGDEVCHISGHMDFYDNLVWSPDSRRIAVISGRTTGGGTVYNSVKLYTLENNVPGESRCFYIVGNDRWYVDIIDPTTVYENTIPATQVVWSPTGEMIAVTFFDHLSIYDATQDEPLIEQAISGLSAVDWSNDGRVIVTGSSDGTIRLWGVSAAD